MNRRSKHLAQFEQFDLIKFFDHYDISYTEHGKNIGSQWVGLDECPFCGISNNHFACNLVSKMFSCWGCGERGNPFKLIKALLQISFSDSIVIIKKFYNGDLEFIPAETGNDVIMPSDVLDLQMSGANYLKSRGFNPFHIRDKFKVKQTGALSFLNHEGKKSNFKHRLIIPIFMNRELVSFTGRDYTNKQIPKYKHVFIEACIIPPSSCLYNIDTVTDSCIIVEGPTDVWRLGDGVISLQGIQHTKEQIRFLAEKNLKKAVVFFDAGKEEEATKLAKILTGFISDVNVAYLDKGDPGELSDINAVQIKHQLLSE